MAEEKSINVFDSKDSQLNVKLIKQLIFSKILSTCPIITNKWISTVLILF